MGQDHQTDLPTAARFNDPPAVVRPARRGAAALMREHGWIEEVRKTNGAQHQGAGTGNDFAAIYGSHEQKYAAAAQSLTCRRRSGARGRPLA